MRSVILLFYILLCAVLHAAPQKLLFLDVWDRSMPELNTTAKTAGFVPDFSDSTEFIKKSAEQAAEYPIVFVLNLDASASPKLTELLGKARRLNPQQRVISLDERGSQIDLEKANLLEKDPILWSYWRPNGNENIERMFTYVRNKYLGEDLRIQPPVLIPDSGFYDPAQESAFTDFTSYRDFKISKSRWKEEAPHAVMLIQQSFWITKDLKVVDAQINALERNGLNTIVIFGDSEAKARNLISQAQPDILIEDRHGGMWDSPDFLIKLDVPYLRPISMLGSTIKEWQDNPLGLSYRDIGLFMSLQESWGTIEPIVVGGLKANIAGFKLHEPIPERVETFAARAARWANLHRKKNNEKKFAIIYYNKGLGQDDLMRGSPTGAFLDGPESLINFFPKMKNAGYHLENLPSTSAELIAQIKQRGRNLGPWASGDLEKLVDSGNPILIPLSKYQQWFSKNLTAIEQAAVIKSFGPPPGKLMVVTRNGEQQIVLPRIDCGNIILMPQPERGEKQDEKLLHSRDVPPPHNYLAFYWWLDQEYQADAICHWGTHGSLELLPGKENGLSADSWGDICIGHLPVINLWITDNLGESTMSRRRSYAALVDHLPPPTVGAGLADSFKNLHDEIHKFNTLEEGLLKEEFRKSITKLAKKDHLEAIADPSLTSSPFSQLSIDRLDTHLHELYESQTPVRLHILGKPPVEADRIPYLVSILGKDFLDHVRAASNQHGHHHEQDIREEAAKFLEARLAGKTETHLSMTADLEKDIVRAREILEKLLDIDMEIDGLIHALNGGYIPAGPGPDPIRNPSTLPTGRNLFSLNPEEIPSRAAWEVGQQLVTELLKQRIPEKIGMDLNGMDTMRDFGVMESQIFSLLGVRPIWNKSNQVIDIELVSTSELGHPRVDVFIAMGGMYKENFPSRVKLLDKAVKLAASAKEEDNSIYRHSLKIERNLLAKGYSSKDAAKFSTARIFGSKPGNVSGTNILYLVPRSGVWENPDDITSVYMDNMSYVYSGDTWGKQIDGLYEEAINDTDTIIRVWASNMTSQLSNHHAYEYLGGLNMAVKKVTGKTPAAYISDVRDPNGARIRDFQEVLDTNFRSELLNKKWIEGMKGNGYAGAGHITELVKNTFGWSVTRPESVTQGTWNDIYETYVADSREMKMQEFFEKVSPHALQELSATMLEAARKGIWQASPEQLATLTKIYAESVAKHGESGGLVGGGNNGLLDYVSEKLISAGGQERAELVKALQRQATETATAGGKNKVIGKKLESKKPPKKPTASPEKASPLPFTHNLWSIAATLLILFLLSLGFIKKSGSV